MAIMSVGGRGPINFAEILWYELLYLEFVMKISLVPQPLLIKIHAPAVPPIYGLWH